MFQKTAIFLYYLLTRTGVQNQGNQGLTPCIATTLTRKTLLISTYIKCTLFTIIYYKMIRLAKIPFLITFQPPFPVTVLSLSVHLGTVQIGVNIAFVGDYCMAD